MATDQEPGNAPAKKKFDDAEKSFENWSEENVRRNVIQYLHEAARRGIEKGW